MDTEYKYYHVDRAVSSGIRNAVNGDAVPLDSLNLSPQLKAKIQSWLEEYDEHNRPSYWETDVSRLLDNQGIEIAKLIPAGTAESRHCSVFFLNEHDERVFLDVKERNERIVLKLRELCGLCVRFLRRTSSAQLEKTFGRQQADDLLGKFFQIEV